MALLPIRHWFAHPVLLGLLLLLLALGVVSVVAWRHRRQALARLGGGLAFRDAIAPRSPLRHLRRICLLLGLLLVVVGMAGPQWGLDYSQAAAPGRDVVIVLDLSRSMFAEQPSRLERARALILDLIRALEARGGHRVALVVFAGRPKVACPLTHDYDHFRDVLNTFDRDHYDPDLAAPENGVSGTRIGAALAAAVQAHDSRYPGVQDVVLFSDGDDPIDDEEWREGAQLAQARRIVVHTVGVGDPTQYHAIPQDDGKLRHFDEEVKTLLEEKPLRHIAELTHGTYVAAQRRDVPVGDILMETLSAGPVREESGDSIPVYQQRYPWFLGPGLAFLGLALVLPDHRLGRGRRR